MEKDIKPLYRKVNTKARHCNHMRGGDAKYDRGAKNGVSKSMKRDVERGLDYTPLYKFLLSKVGEDWSNIYNSIVNRVEDKDTIFWMVARFKTDKKDIVRVDESTYYSGLFIDEDNILRKVRPELRNEDLYPSCPCCTHSFNGKPFNNKYTLEQGFIIREDK